MSIFTPALTTPFDDKADASANLASIFMDQDLSINLGMWQEQVERYKTYRAWFSGEALNVTSGSENTPRFPLKINTARNFTRKRARVLMGEAEDTFHPLVKTVVSALTPLDGSQEAPESSRKMARIAETIVNEVWVQSGGRALQQENANLNQYMGGCIFKLSSQPWRANEFRIPIFIEKTSPEHFFPIWNPKDPLDLYEVYEVYKIPSSVAKAKYGYDAGGAVWVTYIEHWTKEKYSIFLDGKPLTSSNGGKTTTYKDLENPWGFCPYVYIPAMRDGGSFWGSSFLDDIIGLIKEFNARMADNGDAIRDTVHRQRYTRNIEGNPTEKKIAGKIWAIDLGKNRIGSAVNGSPEIFSEDAPSYSESMFKFSSSLWQQLLREADLQGIAYGEDEGSQRSALTMAFRFWPTTSSARWSRTFWTDGLNWLAKAIITMVVKSSHIKVDLPEKFALEIVFSQDWHPMIPRDREQEINEVVLLYQAGLISLKRSLERLGDVREVEAEIELIEEEQKKKSELAIAPKNDTDGKQGEGAKGGVPEPGIDNDTGTDE